MLGSYDVIGLCLLVETVDSFGKVHWLRFSTNGSWVSAHDWWESVSELDEAFPSKDVVLLL